MRVGVRQILDRVKTTRVVPAGLLAALLMIGAAQTLVAAPAVPANIALDTQGHGWRMTDSAGMSLYTFARDVKPGASNCLDECAMAWPPVAAPEDFEPGAGWSVVERPDGIRQLAYEDKPLYRNRVDQRPGDTYGEGVRAQWYLAVIPRPTPPGITIQKTLAGYVAADKANKTLYAPDESTNPASLCVEQACSDAWQPLVAPWLANDLDRWSVLVREDGLRQWAF
jgi:predicted lipoprotein with Yx(FWY)xxD motif